jgi:hypothetical protein
MNSIIRVPLNSSPEQFERLLALQSAFAEVCNALAPEVQRSKVWNRVALHHLHYRNLRVRFPALGSQMICNAIYAVSRTSRLVFQTPASPFNLAKLGTKPLPLLNFANSCPVYFDRHTLSIKGTQLSLFTLDGRMHFQLTLPSEQLLMFKVAKLREISLIRRLDNLFELSFWLDTTVAPQILVTTSTLLPGGLVPALPEGSSSLIPSYVSVEVTS